MRPSSALSPSPPRFDAGGATRQLEDRPGPGWPDAEPPDDGTVRRAGTGGRRPAPSLVTPEARPDAMAARRVVGAAAASTAGWSEEAAWVARARAGDQDAFAELFTRYERRIYAFVYRMMGNPEDAGDLTQETFLKAYRALGRVPSGRDEALNVNAWLHRIAANACLDVLRRRQLIRWVPWELAKHDRPSRRREDDPEDALLGEQARGGVRRALAAMSPRSRQALVLRECAGLSCEEIGAIMGASRQAVKSLLFRSREEFRRCYARIADGASR